MPSPNKPDAIADFLGWLGRQVGHISKAVKTEVTSDLAPVVPPEHHVMYRDERVEEQSHPHHADVLLRRTVVDEVVVRRSSQPGPVQEGPSDEQPG